MTARRPLVLVGLGDVASWGSTGSHDGDGRQRRDEVSARAA
jgi:hypothetical protein